MQTIYVDVLIVLNVYVNCFILLSAAKITHSRLSRVRCFFVSLYGSFYSLLILIPEINGLLNFAVKIFAGVTIALLAFGIKNKTRFIMNLIAFFAVNFLLAGAVYAVYISLKPSFIEFNNTYFYIDFSLLTLIVVTAGLYALLCISRWLSDRFSAASAEYTVYIKYRGRMTAVKGLADTGNSLVDFFSGKPVVICSQKRLAEIVTLDLKAEKLPKGFRIIPYSTIGNSGMMTVFSPDEVIISDDEKGLRKSADVLIGIKGSGDCAIFNPELLKM